MIQRDLSFYYPDCNKEVCLVIASESLQCIRPTQVIASYYSVSLIVSATSSAKKKKVDIERRAFNPAWKEKYFFYGALWTAQCLICLKTVAVLKEFNMRRHWEAEHRASNFGSMSPAETKYAIDRLSGNLQKTTSFFRKQTAEADKIVRASYDVSRILARWMKPFSDGDFIKECHVAVVDSVCPEQRSVCETVRLSSRTVRRRIEDMSQLLASVPDDVEPDTCVSVVASMREEFASRFAGIKPLAAEFKQFTAPFDFPVDDAPATCVWSWWSLSAMMNSRRSSTTLHHCPSSTTSPSLLGMFLHSLRMFNAS